MAKQLGYKNIKASIALGEELIIPYTQSKVFADIDDKTGELFILVKHTKDPSIHLKLFFKEEEPGDDNVEIIEETKNDV